MSDSKDPTQDVTGLGSPHCYPSLSPEQLDSILERYDQTNPELQREITGSFANRVYWLEEVVRHCKIGNAPDNIRAIFDHVNQYG